MGGEWKRPFSFDEDSENTDDSNNPSEFFDEIVSENEELNIEKEIQSKRNKLQKKGAITSRGEAAKLARRLNWRTLFFRK